MEAYIVVWFLFLILTATGAHCENAYFSVPQTNTSKHLPKFFKRGVTQ